MSDADLDKFIRLYPYNGQSHQESLPQTLTEPRYHHDWRRLPHPRPQHILQCWRYSLDDHGDCARAAHDTRRWVRPVPFDARPNLLTISAASSTLVSPVENQLSP